AAGVMAKITASPRLDFAGFGGVRGGALTDVPLAKGGVVDEDVDRVGQALAALSGTVLNTTRASVEAAHRAGDFSRRRGATFTKGRRGPTAASIADELEEIARLLNDPSAGE